MTGLHATTLRRLRKIPQIPSVWEGERRPVSDLGDALEPDEDGSGDCVIWVDGSEGVVRAIDVVKPEDGPEAMVRTLLRAIETPHSYTRPARPQKIILRDREAQFFLRGALQSLEIAVDYAPDLPAIDDLFRGFQENSGSRPPHLPPDYESALLEVARDLWHAPPWHHLADSDILEIAIDQPDTDPLYACVMGMLGQEFGILLYRSLESLRQFREAILDQSSLERMEQAFLQQDCWFLNYEPDDAVEEEASPAFAQLFAPALRAEDVEPRFGSVHPYEGLRPFLGDEEAVPVYLALRALQRFVVQSRRDLEADPIPAFSRRHQIALTQPDGRTKRIAVEIATRPDLAAEFAASAPGEDWDESDGREPLPLRDDLIPDGAIASIGMVDWRSIETLRQSPQRLCQDSGATATGEGMPAIVIQTSRPKAKALAKTLQEAGGLDGIGFNPGENPFTGTLFDLGILCTRDGMLHLFGEFVSDDPTHVQARRHWDRRTRATQGYCALIVAGGVTGAARGNPGLREMLALFETKALSTDELGLGTLQLVTQFEPD